MTIRNTKTGDEITVNFEDIEEGRFSFTTDEGEITVEVDSAPAAIPKAPIRIAAGIAHQEVRRRAQRLGGRDSSRGPAEACSGCAMASSISGGATARYHCFRSDDGSHRCE